MSTPATCRTALEPLLRPVRADDRPAMQRFLQGLSVASRRLRFHGSVKPESESVLRLLTQADGRHHIAWVAVLPCDDGEIIVGEARCARQPEGEDSGEAEFAIAVADAWQGRGLAQRLLNAVLREARAAGFDTVVGEVLADNGRMAAFMQREGFSLGGSGSDVQRWTRTLPPLPRAPHSLRVGMAAWLAAVLRRPLSQVTA
jgi:acetyltransferase